MNNDTVLSYIYTVTHLPIFNFNNFKIFTITIFIENPAYLTQTSKSPFRIKLVARKHNHTILSTIYSDDFLFIKCWFFFYKNNNIQCIQSFIFLCRSCRRADIKNSEGSTYDEITIRIFYLF